jgi:Family of unknown function (DUF6496)/Hemerythrin HHE cation binding domain
LEVCAQDPAGPALKQGKRKMFDWLLPEKHAISILKKDHDRVKELFDQFEKADSPTAKKKIIDKALTELKIHAILEEEIFYPTVRKHIGDKLMNEADEEHHVAKVLIAELDQSGAGRNGHRDAKFTVLSENVRHHIQEEEEQMLPKAKELHIDFERLGQTMLDRKAELLSDGTPKDAEHAMVAEVGGNDDSPAMAAARSRSIVHPLNRREPVAKKASSSETKGKRKVAKVMKEHKEGKLKSGSGKKVTSRKQAVAIALNEARKSGAKIPKKKKS